MDLSRDPEYRKLVRITKSIRNRYDFDKGVREVDLLHDSRKSINLVVSKKRYDPREVYDAVTMDMAYRGRLVKMLMRIRKDTDLLNEAIASLQNYLIVEYPDTFTGTRNDRQIRLDRVCRPAIALSEECESHMDTIELVIKDIDQSNFQFRHIVALMAMFQETGARNI